MSRTYRKSNKWYNCWWFPDERHDAAEVYTRDGKCWENTKWHFKQVHRVGRLVNREQFAQLRKCEDLEEFSFDPSKHTKKRKSVWWEIY